MYAKQHNVKIKQKSTWQKIKSHFISCANICSIHGIVHIVRKNANPYERLLWLLLVISAMAWCIVLALEAWNHYQTRPTVITIERDHWKWNTTFPSVTLCLQSIDSDKMNMLIRSMEIPKDLHNSFRDFVKELAVGNFLTYYKFEAYKNISLFQNTDKYLEWVLSTQVTMEDVEIAQSFGRLNLFETIFTELGLCFAYNSQIATYSTPEYRSKRTMRLVKQNDTILVNPTISFASVTLTNLFGGYKIFFHGPNEIPDIITKGIAIPEATFTTFELLVDSVSTPPDVKNLKISQRNCRLPEESNLKHSPIYSYNLCRMECRIEICLKLCNCIPYYYRRLGNEPICNATGLFCLSKYEGTIVHLLDQNKKPTCRCMQNCDTNSIIISKYEKTDWFLGTNVKWFVVQYPTVRYKRSLIFSQINLLVQMGGIAGLFLGCSVLSLFELIYFMTIRFYWGVVKEKIIE